MCLTAEYSRHGAGNLTHRNRAVPDLVPLVWDTPGIEAAIPKDAVGQAVTMFEPQECANYFKSCGYDPE